MTPRTIDEGKTLTPKRTYRNPPVHEVVLDLQFNQEAPLLSLDLPLQPLAELIGPPQAIEEAGVEMRVGPGGQQEVRVTPKKRTGWRFDSQDQPKWVLMLTPVSFALHAVRSQDWPRGKYIGWDAIRERFERVLDLLNPIYRGSGPKRLGLRYLNRFAVPEPTELTAWVKVEFQAPTMLKEPFAFNCRQTWATISGHESLSATLGLAKIEIENPELREGRQGVLLDIEVFNLRIQRAPAFEEIRDWFREAHEVENQIFEECITDQLRDTFD